MYFRKENQNLFDLYRSLIVESTKADIDIKDIVKDGMIDPKVWPKLELKIQRCKYLLMKKSIFIGNVLARLKVCFSTDIDTMAVDDYGNIYISPSYALKLSEDEVVGVLAHEAMHIITLSFFRKRGRDHQLWNIATDYIMNMYLFQDGFVMDEGGCDPVKKGDRWVIPELKGKKTVKDLDVTEMSADKLYDILVDIAIPKDQRGQQSALPIEVGDVIYDEVKGKYGVVTAVGKDIHSTEIPESEIDKHLK
jgi:Putative metallopeptidase domain